MKKLNIFNLVAVFALATAVQSVVRADVELPEEELAKESVLPKFENTTVVKNRNVGLAHKLEVGGYYGWNFSEAIENQGKYGVNLGYHFDETHAVVINYAVWASGLNTQYTDQLYAQYKLDFNRAPAQQNSIWVNYEPTMFYGKLSLMKNTVANFHFYPILGIGQNTYSNKSYFAFNVGGGWKYYFSPNWGMCFDLKFQYGGKPSPFLRGNMKTTDPMPSQGAFADQNVLSTIFDIGMVLLF